MSGSSDETIRLWDAATGDGIGKPLEGHSSSVKSVSFSPNGSRIVSGSFDYTIRLWDAEMSDIIPTLSSRAYSKLLPSGWAVNSKAEKLFWVPPWSKPGLCFTRNTITILRDGTSTVLDISKFVHGVAWERCRTD